MVRRRLVGQPTRPRASSRLAPPHSEFITAFTKTRRDRNPYPDPPRGEGEHKTPTPTLPEGRGHINNKMGNDGNYNTASPDIYLLLKDFAQTNKRFQTDAERLLWEHIRAKQLSVKFNRQHIIGDYIVDFVCIEKKLVIEVDGGYHSEYEQIEKDEFRTQRLNDLGFHVIRFKNEEIVGNLPEVLNTIKNNLIKRHE
jgi:very-short-patch-repair endonuclease